MYLYIKPISTICRSFDICKRTGEIAGKQIVRETQFISVGSMTNSTQPSWIFSETSRCFVKLNLEIHGFDQTNPDISY